MKNTKCPERKICFSYKGNDCEGCAVGDEITKLHKRIDRLKKQNETLTIQRNAWALTAKALTPEWISVAERFPKPFETVLVFCDTGVSKFQCVSEMIEPDGKRWSAVCGFRVTHWMPLPTPPMMEGGAE